MVDSEPRPANRLLLAFEMWDFGVEMTRARLQREHPEESAPEIQTRLNGWLRTRPGAEFGDGTGRPVQLSFS